jgi:PhnB protein
VTFDKLADDGKVHGPLEFKFWGAICVVVEDRFGMIWESNCYGS